MRTTIDQRQRTLGQELSKILKELPQEDSDLRRHVESMSQLARSGTFALHRESYDPGHFTASGFVLSPGREKLLLIFHSKLGMWLQPGGHIEASDTDLVAAARREVQEETGLTDLVVEMPFFDFDVHPIPALGDKPPHVHFDVRCLFSTSEIDVQPGDGVSQARWFELPEVFRSENDLADGFGTDESVRRVARRLFEMK